jgi:hypothetical protein
MNPGTPLSLIMPAKSWAGDCYELDGVILLPPQRIRLSDLCSSRINPEIINLIGSWHDNLNEWEAQSQGH